MPGAKCGKCVKPALIGSRCIRCYVVRQARLIGIAKSGWWLKDVDRFAELLYYRYLAMQEGQAPDVATVVSAFSKHEVNAARYAPRVQKVTAIVAKFDEMVRRQHAARTEPGPDAGSEAGG